MDGRRRPVRVRHHALTLENVPGLQSRIHPVRPPQISQVHHRKLAPGDSSRTHPLRICNDPDNKLLRPYPARTHIHPSRRCPRPSCPRYCTRNSSPSRPKIHITDETSSETCNTTIGSRTDASATREPPKENGDSRSIGSGLVGDRVNPNGHRRQYLGARRTRKSSLSPHPRLGDPWGNGFHNAK